MAGKPAVQAIIHGHRRAEVWHNQPVRLHRGACAGTLMPHSAVRNPSRIVIAHPLPLRQVVAPARKELCYFSPFKRWLQRNRISPASSWALYMAAFSGPLSLRRELDQSRGNRRRGMGAAAAELDASCEAAGRLSFEACPFYLGERKTAAHVHHVFPALRAVAILRNPRERTVSAFNDYVRMGRIRGQNATANGMDAIVRYKIDQLASGQRTLESFDMRILTSGVYIHGLEAWGQQLSNSQLLVIRSEDMFADVPGTVARMDSFLGLTPRSQMRRHYSVSNRNPIKKSRASRELNMTLDAFFAPYNEGLYEWAARRSIPFPRWENASVQG